MERGIIFPNASKQAGDVRPYVLYRADGSAYGPALHFIRESAYRDRIGKKDRIWSGGFLGRAVDNSVLWVFERTMEGKVVRNCGTYFVLGDMGVLQSGIYSNSGSITN